jgi:hypothetical protein
MARALGFDDTAVSKFKTSCGDWTCWSWTGLCEAVGISLIDFVRRYRRGGGRLESLRVSEEQVSVDHITWQSVEQFR